jgi:tripartite-type tricarboxylate transporter receptor subunit TctC
MQKFRRRSSVLVIGSYCVDSNRSVHGQTQPPVRILVGAPAGGSTDTLARSLARRWAGSCRAP